MIPKIIHYCWFGRGEMPDLAKRCIASWHRYLPEYDYRLWNEDTFDVKAVPYVCEAYEARKFAFVTDYVRLWVLEKFGGVYMDTDVEILKPLDEYLQLPAFTGYEGSSAMAPVTGLMASAAHGIWVTEQLEYYSGRHFRMENGTLDLTPNTEIIAQIMSKNGFVVDGKYAVYKNDMHVFPADYFCPLTSTRILKLTANTVCIHHFAGSWIERSKLQRIKNFVIKYFIGYRLADKIVRCKRRWKLRGK